MPIKQKVDFEVKIGLIWRYLSGKISMDKIEREVGVNSERLYDVMTLDYKKIRGRGWGWISAKRNRTYFITNRYKKV